MATKRKTGTPRTTDIGTGRKDRKTRPSEIHVEPDTVDPDSGNEERQRPPAFHLADRLSFPILRTVDTSARIFDMLRHAAIRRKGMAIGCPQGGGKTVGLHAAVEQFALLERKKREKNPLYTPVSVGVLRTLREQNALEIIAHIYRGVFHSDLALRDRGQRKSYTDLRDELVAALLTQRVACLVIDEAETLSESALSVLRDLMSCAEAVAVGRYSGEGGGRYSAAGVGVLLIGTPELLVKIRTNNEATRRWVRTEVIDLLPKEAVANIYREMYPACEEQAKTMGDDAWARLIARSVCRDGLDVPVSFIENHLWEFHLRLCNTQRAAHIDELAFDETVFLYSLNIARLAPQPDKLIDWRESA